MHIFVSIYSYLFLMSRGNLTFISAGLIILDILEKKMVEFRTSKMVMLLRIFILFGESP